MIPDELRPYVDAGGRITLMPSTRRKHALRRLVYEYLASKFEFGRVYTEREVNMLLNAHHTFGDPAFLRREMFEGGWLNREPDGSAYWRTNTVMY